MKSEKNLSHAILVIPGLNDRRVRMSFLMNGWVKDGFSPIIHIVNWHDGEHFDPKLHRLDLKIDELASQYAKVSLIGASAGGSAAFNAFLR